MSPSGWPRPGGPSRSRSGVGAAANSRPNSVAVCVTARVYLCAFRVRFVPCFQAQKSLHDPLKMCRSVAYVCGTSEAHAMTTDEDLRALLEHGAACVRVARGGKVPLGRAWHTLAATTADVIGGWLSGGYNVGILLGHGGLVDVEYDDAAGRAMLERLGLRDARTPTYSSGRGEHRIFRLVDPVPECAWRKRGGIEVRYGGRPAQSVLPPSRHPDGGFYRWTISPRDCEPLRVRLADLSLEGI